MFLKVEGEQLVNLSLMDRVEMDHHRKEASAWASGVRLHSDSAILYDFFVNPPRGMMAPPPLPRPVKAK